LAEPGPLSDRRSCSAFAGMTAAGRPPVASAALRVTRARFRVRSVCDILFYLPRRLVGISWPSISSPRPSPLDEAETRVGRSTRDRSRDRGARIRHLCPFCKLQSWWCHGCALVGRVILLRCSCVLSSASPTGRGLQFLSDHGRRDRGLPCLQRARSDSQAQSELPANRGMTSFRDAQLRYPTVYADDPEYRPIRTLSRAFPPRPLR
jgi:hypothetical protein